MIVLTKSDLQKYTDISKDNKAKIEAIAKENNSFLIQMSNKSGEGIADVRAKACEILLDHRLT